MTDSNGELKRQEEAKRARMLSPAQRWQAFLALLAWAEKQPNAPLRTPAARKAEERRKLAYHAAWQAAQRAKAVENGGADAAGQ